MKINFDQEIKKDDGTSIVSETKSFQMVEKDGEFTSEPTNTYKKNTILADVCSDALRTNVIKVDVDETMMRFNLHNKIKEGGEVLLSKDELISLKDLVNNKYDLMMAGKILVMLGEK